MLYSLEELQVMDGLLDNGLQGTDMLKVPDRSYKGTENPKPMSNLWLLCVFFVIVLHLLWSCSFLCGLTSLCSHLYLFLVMLCLFVVEMLCSLFMWPCGFLSLSFCIFSGSFCVSFSLFCIFVVHLCVFVVIFHLFVILNASWCGHFASLYSLRLSNKKC